MATDEFLDSNAIPGTTELPDFAVVAIGLVRDINRSQSAFAVVQAPEPGQAQERA